MLKHQEIIEKLTIEQKLALIADVASLGKEDLSAAGVRSVSLKTMERVNEKTGELKYPMFSALVNSWDRNLISNVSDTLAARAKANGVTLLEIPSVNVKSSPYSEGLSEDPILVAELSKASADAIHKRGVAVCVTDPAMSENDAIYSDVTPNQSAINDYFKKPFELMLSHNVSAVKTANRKLDGAYKDVNDQWLKDVSGRYQTIVESRSGKETVETFLEGKKFILGGSYTRLKEAYEKYQMLHAAFESGAMSYNELQTECGAGSAISPETIDAFVDRIVDFSLACENKKGITSTPEGENLALLAAEGSIVLLKNKEQSLPLQNGAKVAVIGDLADQKDEELPLGVRQYAERLKKQGDLQFVGFARGYDYTTSRNEDLIKEAVTMANTAEYTLVVLGYDKRGAKLARGNRTTRLPANQMALIDALKKTTSKLIVVIAGDIYPDMRFEDISSATLLADVTATKSAEALWNILRGKTCPSGRLSFTCYNDTDEHYNELWGYKENARNKVGSFYGYRHYDTSGIVVKYPFGFGLSYTSFEYSNLMITADGFSFSVKNKGKMGGAEVVQVYIGKKDSAAIRPRKELKTFVKLFLKPNEEKKITVKFKGLDLKVWDETRKKYVCERGQYDLFIGSSVKDIRLQGTFHYGLETVTKTTEKYSDYLQTYSNIHRGGYYLEEPINGSAAKELIKKGSIVFSILMLCVDIIYGYFAYVKWVPNHWALYVTLALCNIIPMWRGISSLVKYKKQIQQEQVTSMEAKKQKREALNVEDLADEIPFEQLFEQEFSVVIKTKKEEKVTEERREEKKRVIGTQFDKEFLLPQIAKEFSIYVYERGIKVDAQSVKKLFASLAASRLVIMKNSNVELTEKFLNLMNEYLGAASSLQTYASVAENGLFYRKNAYEGVHFDGASVLENTFGLENKIRLISLTGVKCEGMKGLLAPLVRYIDQPSRECSVPVKIGVETKECEVMENTWLVMALEKGEDVTQIPEYLLDMATVLDMDLQSGLGDVIATQETPVEERMNAVETAKETTEKTEEQMEASIEETVNEETAVAETTGEIIEDVKTQPIIQAATTPIPTTKVKEKTPVKQLTYSQFKKLMDYACRDYALDEVLWKRVDKLEEFVAGCNEYRIENKMWLRMEKYVSTYLAMGGDAEEALDCVVAQQLIYGMLPCIQTTKKPLEEKFTHTLENIFGEGQVPCSLKVVRESGLV